MFKIYRIISLLIIPIIFINILLRILINKEDRIRYKERFGISSAKRPNKNIIWIHAASVGEFKSSDIIIENFYKNYCILVTTTTKSAANYAIKNYSNKIIHQFAPFDVEIWVNRFIRFWRPNLVIWIESDLWPNTLNIIKKNKIKCIFLNARISPNSFSKWSFVKGSYKELISCFSQIFAQSKNDLMRIKNLSNINIEYIGNLKLAKLSNNNPLLKKEKANKINIMLASTHDGEEKILLSLIKKIITNNNVNKIFIAPRHPERTNKIENIFNSINITTNKESDDRKDNSKIIIINSLGNLTDYFKSSDIVFLGGSLTSNGGHNPIEPALYNCAIISGKNVFNWENLYQEMFDENACYLSNNIKKLEEKIETLINNESMLLLSKEKALNFSKKKFFDKKRLFNVINENLKKHA